MNSPWICRLRCQLIAHVLRNWCTILQQKHMNITNTWYLSCTPKSWNILVWETVFKQNLPFSPSLLVSTCNLCTVEWLWTMLFFCYFKKLCTNLTVLTCNLDILIFSLYYIFLISLKSPPLNHSYIYRIRDIVLSCQLVKKCTWTCNL